MTTVARLAPGKVLWIATCEDGYNNQSVLRFTDERGRSLQRPTITDPSGEEAETNLTYDPATRMLASTFYGNSTRTRGETHQWVWDGERFRFFRKSRMDECEGMSRNDWPVLYRAQIVDR